MEQRRLYRSRDRMIGGVSGGIADYLGLDPTVVRLIWIVFAFTGAGVLAYILGMILIPEEPVGFNENSTSTSQDKKQSNSEHVPGRPHRTSVDPTNNRSLGIILLAVGLGLLLRNLLPGFPWRLTWPALLIIGGFALIITGFGDKR